MNILILGATGMLGSTLFRVFQEQPHFNTWGTLRDTDGLRFFPKAHHARLIPQVDVLNQQRLLDVFEQVQPDLVINAVGLIKQLASANDPLVVLPINAMLPHRLAALCTAFQSRLVLISTDCVFSGRKGCYSELDYSDADDLYGRSKLIGEVVDLPHVLTLRTSLIGHELNSNHSLVDWFLSQTGPVQGYVNAIFSGLPTGEMARVIYDYIIPAPDLCGLYHVAAQPINKFDLLALVATHYGKTIKMSQNEAFHMDRSLNAQKFQAATGYVAPAWPELIAKMHQSYCLLQEIVHVE